MTDDPARYLVSRYRTLYDTAESAFCARGYVLLIDSDLARRGYSLVDWPMLTAVVRDLSSEPIAHELFHLWTLENIALGIDYEPPGWQASDPEDCACRFAWGVGD
jgi:hypothetical protein